MQQAAALCVLEHIERGARLDRAADIEPFKLDQYVGAIRREHTVQTDHRRMADRFQDIAVYHEISSSQTCLFYIITQLVA